MKLYRVLQGEKYYTYVYPKDSSILAFNLITKRWPIQFYHTANTELDVYPDSYGAFTKYFHETVQD